MSCALARSLYQQASTRSKGKGSSICATVEKKNLMMQASRGRVQYVPIGNHTLQQRVKKMCAEAGIGGHKTNHSLRATGTTELIKRGAPEKLIQERTGYRSLEALRTYERLSEEQRKAASALLSVPNHLPHYSHIVNTSTSTKTQAAPSTHGVSSMPVSFQILQGCTINIIGSPILCTVY